MSSSRVVTPRSRACSKAVRDSSVCSPRPPRWACRSKVVGRLSAAVEEPGRPGSEPVMLPTEPAEPVEEPGTSVAVAAGAEARRADAANAAERTAVER